MSAKGEKRTFRAIAIYVRSWGLIPSLDDDHTSHGAKRSSRFRCPVSGALPGRHKARRPRPALGSPAPTHPPDRYRESGPARSAGAWGSPRAIAASYRATDTLGPSCYKAFRRTNEGRRPPSVIRARECLWPFAGSQPTLCAAQPCAARRLRPAGS